MLRAGVPVAAVDEDGDALLGEDDVGRAVEARLRSVGDAEAKAGRVEASSYGELGDVSRDRLPCMTLREAALLAQLSYGGMHSSSVA